MSVTVESTIGWAFLVARGRYRGYRSILVPDFLADTDERSVIAESISGDVDSAGSPRIRPLIAGNAGPITVVYRSHRMTPADLAAGEVGASDCEFVADEHGRPLDLLYGFVSRAIGVAEVREEDLATAKRQALDVYRQFLSDEAGFRTSTSHAYPVQVVAEPAVPKRRPAPDDSGGRHIAPILAAVAAIVGVLVFGVVTVAWLRDSDEHPTLHKCHLASSDDGATCQIPVEIPAPIADRRPFTVHPDSPVRNGAKWTAQVSDCAQPAPGKGCIVTVTLTVIVPGNDQTKHTNTVTIDDSKGKSVQTLSVEAYR